MKTVHIVSALRLHFDDIKSRSNQECDIRVITRKCCELVKGAFPRNFLCFPYCYNWIIRKLATGQFLICVEFGFGSCAMWTSSLITNLISSKRSTLEASAGESIKYSVISGDVKAHLSSANYLPLDLEETVTCFCR